MDIIIHVQLHGHSPVQYAADYMYNDVMSEIYISNNAEEEKNNNYTLLVRKDNKVRRCSFHGFALGFEKHIFTPLPKYLDETLSD